MNDKAIEQQPPVRKRGLTSLTLGWLAERLRRVEELRTKVDNGDYTVESDKVAASIVNQER